MTLILVLEDDGLVSMLLDELIHNEFGMRCEIASTVEDAYRRVMERGEEFALGIIDLRIGTDSRGGLKLAGMIRQMDDPQKASLPLVLMTGDPDRAGIAEATAGLGFAEFLRKPFLPEGLEAAIMRYARDAKPVSPGRSYILTVEDDEILGSMYCRALRNAGYEAECVTTAEAAIESVAQREPDLLLVDLRLPDADGGALARQLRERGVSCPFVAVTGWAERAQSGGDDFIELLMKPLRIADLVAVARRHIPA